MRVLVCGGRDFIEMKLLVRVLDELHAERAFTHLIHGDARGADLLAAHWARMRQVHTTAYPADWKRLGKSAGSVRNQKMLVEGQPALVVAFPGGVGTADMIMRAESVGVETIKVAKDGRF